MASAGAASAPVNDPQSPAIATAQPSFLTRISSGAACFYWIAALTLLNSLVVLFGGSLHFVIGLGITAAVDAKAKDLGTIGAILDLLINGTVAGIFFLLGSLASKRTRWAFIVGMALYGADGLLLLAAKDMLSVAFHVYSLLAIWWGLRAIDRERGIKEANI
jgi:hypothetical protein